MGTLRTPPGSADGRKKTDSGGADEGKLKICLTLMFLVSYKNVSSNFCYYCSHIIEKANTILEKNLCMLQFIVRFIE
jgi:hypothetical protein